MIDGIRNAINPKRREEHITDIHYRLISKYQEVPQWWYLLVFFSSLGMAFATLIIYVPEAPKWVHSFLEPSLMIRH